MASSLLSFLDSNIGCFNCECTITPLHVNMVAWCRLHACNLQEMALYHKEEVYLIIKQTQSNQYWLDSAIYFDSHNYWIYNNLSIKESCKCHKENFRGSLWRLKQILEILLCMIDCAIDILLISELVATLTKQNVDVTFSNLCDRNICDVNIVGVKGVPDWPMYTW